MSRVQLTEHQRNNIREFAFTQLRQRPTLAAGGTTLADSLRRTLPGLADEEIAAVLCQVTPWIAQNTRLCSHLAGVADILGAVIADLAALDIADPR